MKNTNQSTYMRIHYEIANEIAMGVYKAGDLLPTHTELSEKYHVSRVTISEAIKELSRRGILRTQKGKGTYVVGQPMEIGNFQRFEGFSKFSNQNKDRRLTSRVIFNDIVEAPVGVAELLGIPANTLMVNIIRVRSVDNIPMSYESSFLKHSYVGEIDFKKENLETGSLYAVLREKAGINFKYSKEKLRATYCPDNVCSFLGVGRMEPILFINRVCGIDEDELVECVEIYERSDISYTSFQSSRQVEEKTEVNRKVFSAAQETKNKIADSMIGGLLANELFDDDVKEKGLFGEWLEKYMSMADKMNAVHAAEPSLLEKEADDFYMAILSGIVNTPEEAVKKTAEVLISRKRSRSAVSAGCALSAMMSACMKRDTSSAELSDRAIKAAVEGNALSESAGLKEMTVNVAKRIKLALSLTKGAEDYEQVMRDYCDIWGWCKEIENTVPAVLCLLVAAGFDYPSAMKKAKKLLPNRMAAVLFGLLSGALYSRSTFPEELVSLILENVSKCDQMAEIASETRKSIAAK
ncbi:MAG: GntR family transcriptional regulator [Lachnospiraceae bacterium]|nr:GntR family transcriptional regulator [Lachnospiraceae bacterium]